MGMMIATKSLTKQYSGKNVIKNLNLNVPEGSIYGFLGPNGAGKSTTMKMLLGLVKPSAGSIRIMGREISSSNRLDILRQTGSLIESPSYYGHLSGTENLQIVCRLKGADEKEIDHVLEIVRMKNQQEKKAKNYSLGMKQRLGLAAALLGNPKLLLLDEPTNGLDPAGIQEMRELICSLPQQYGITILVSSHLLSEIDQMATDVGIINHGELIFQAPLSSLHAHSRGKMKLMTTNNPEAYALLKKAGMEIALEPSSGALILDTTEDARILRCGRLLFENHMGLLRLEEINLSLEEIFLKLTGKQVSL